jgi:hypothetical protein
MIRRGTSAILLVAIMTLLLSMNAYATGGGEQPDVAPVQLGDAPDPAELEDLATIADQQGISLDLAVERYGWQQSFAMLAASLREAHPSEFAGARIEADGSPWIAFRASAPAEARRMIAEASAAIFKVGTSTIKIVEGRGFAEAELDARLTAAHFAALQQRDLVANASSGYDIGPEQSPSRSSPLSQQRLRRRETRSSNPWSLAAPRHSKGSRSVLSIRFSGRTRLPSMAGARSRRAHRRSQLIVQVCAAC